MIFNMDYATMTIALTVCFGPSSFFVLVNVLDEDPFWFRVNFIFLTIGWCWTSYLLWKLMSTPRNVGIVTSDVFEQSSMKSQLIPCQFCNVLKPPRAHHCRDCEMCYWNRDHHCIWIARCVGRANRKLFIQWLATNTVSLSQMVLLISLHLGPLTVVLDPKLFTISNAIMVVMIMIYGPWCMFGMQLTVWQLFLLAKNQTTSEERAYQLRWYSLSKEHKPKLKFLYNKGSIGKNMVEVMGHSLIEWLRADSPTMTMISKPNGFVEPSWFEVPNDYGIDSTRTIYDVTFIEGVPTTTPSTTRITNHV